MEISPELETRVNDLLAQADIRFAAARERAVVFIAKAKEGSDLDFRVLQLEVAAAIAEAEELLSSAALQSLEPRTDRVQVGGRTYKRLDYTQTDRVYLDLRGEVHVWAARFREVGVRNGPTIVPLELRAGIVEGMSTPRAAAAVGHLAQALPSEEAHSVCESLEVLPTSRSSAYRLANALGTRWDERRAEGESTLLQSLVIPTDAMSISVAVDRVTLPMVEPRELTEKEQEPDANPPKNPISIKGRQVYVGCLTIYNVAGECVHSIRYGWVPDDDGRDTLEEALRHDMLFLIASRPDLRVATLGDGAAEIQQSLDRITVGIRVDYRGLDFWHGAGYIAKAVEAVGGTAKHKECLLDTLKHQSNGAINVLLTLLTWACALEVGLKPDLEIIANPPATRPRNRTEPRLRLVAKDGKLVAPEPQQEARVHELMGEAATRLAEDGAKLRDATLTDRSSTPEFKTAPDALFEAIRYLWNHWERMQYADALALGLPIGSGSVEASCKNLVAVRMKRSGSQWKPDGAQSILHLRSLATSSRWHPGINFLLSTYRAEVRHAHAA